MGPVRLPYVLLLQQLRNHWHIPPHLHQVNVAYLSSIAFASADMCTDTLNLSFALIIPIDKPRLPVEPTAI